MGKSFGDQTASRATFVAQLSPDGKTIATGGLDRTVLLLSAVDGKQVRQLTTHQSPILTLDWSPDGKQVASGSSDACVKFSKIDNHQDNVRQPGTLQTVTYSGDAKTILTGDDYGTLRLWDADTGLERKAISLGSHPLNIVSSSSNGQIAVGNDIGIVYILTAPEAKPIEIVAHQDAVRSIVFSPDGQFVYSGGADKSVHVWDAKSGKKIRTLVGHDGSVTTIAFVPNSETVISGADDRSIKIWDINDGRLLKNLDPDEDDDVLAVAIRPDGKQMISTGSREVPPTIKFWDPSTGALLKLLPGHADRPLHAAYHPNGKLLATVAGDGTIRLWDCVGFKLINTIALRTPKGTISQVVFHPQGDRLATVNGNGTVTVIKIPETPKLETE